MGACSLVGTAANCGWRLAAVMCVGRCHSSHPGVCRRRSCCSPSRVGSAPHRAGPSSATSLCGSRTSRCSAGRRAPSKDGTPARLACPPSRAAARAAARARAASRARARARVGARARVRAAARAKMRLGLRARARVGVGARAAAAAARVHRWRRWRRQWTWAVGTARGGDGGAHPHASTMAASRRYVHGMRTACARHVHCVCTACARHMHGMRTACA